MAIFWKREMMARVYEANRVCTNSSFGDFSLATLCNAKLLIYVFLNQIFFIFRTIRWNLCVWMLLRPMCSFRAAAILCETY